MPLLTTITDIAEPLSEASDYEVTATLVGPDGVTPVEPAAISTLTATLRYLDPPGGTVFTNRDIKSTVASGGVMTMPLAWDDLLAFGDRPLQRRMLTLKLVQTNGKRRNQVVTFAVENFIDV